MSVQAITTQAVPVPQSRPAPPAPPAADNHAAKPQAPATGRRVDITV